MTKTNTYIFPSHTCERVNKNGMVAQPYSAFANFIISIIILYYLIQTKHSSTFLLLFSMLCFAVFHTYSHSVHIPGILQTYTIHILAYCINIALLNVFLSYTKRPPTQEFILYLVGLVSFDIYALFTLPTVISIISQIFITISLLYYYYPYLPPNIKNIFYVMIIPFFIGTFSLINEAYNCEYMLSINPYFPYHIFIEIPVFIFLYSVSSNFYNLPIR